MRFFRFNLLTFLLGITLLGALIGLGVRWHLSRQVVYDSRQRLINMDLKFRAVTVWGSWKRNGLGQEQILYALLMVPGNHESSTQGVPGISSRPSWGKPQPRGIHLSPGTLYFDGQPLEPGCIWLYKPTTESVERLNIDANLVRQISSLDFETIEGTEFWRTELDPAIRREAEAFNRQLYDDPSE